MTSIKLRNLSVHSSNIIYSISSDTTMEEQLPMVSGCGGEVLKDSPRLPSSPSGGISHGAGSSSVPFRVGRCTFLSDSKDERKKHDPAAQNSHCVPADSYPAESPIL